MNALESKLREAGLKFEVQSNGMAQGVFKLPSGRKQTFGIHLAGEDWHGLHEHDVLFPLGNIKDSKQLELLCRTIDQGKRGGVILMDGVALLKFELPSDLDADGWVAQIQAGVTVADMVEKVVFDGKDAV